MLVRLNRGGETALAEAPDPLTIVTTPPSVKDAAPGDGARINTSRPNIFASFQTVGDTGMDADSLRMTLNGRDVTALADAYELLHFLLSGGRTRGPDHTGRGQRHRYCR